MTVRLAIPNTPALATQIVHEQVAIETDATGNFLAVTGTNALRLTIGVF